MRTLLILSISGLGLLAQDRIESRSIFVNGRDIVYQVREGFAVTHGDLILGTVDEVDAAVRGESGGQKALRGAAALTGAAGPLWTNGTLYYVIDATVPNQARITDAVAHWNEKTPLRILPAEGAPNYVRFVRSTDSGYCASSVGMRGGAQTVLLGDGCPTGSMVHEIGHAFGLLHEQERNDRNANITVLYENLDKANYSQYDQTNATRDLGYYDYDSIMQYSPWGFAENYVTIETVPVGIPLGQRTGLSAGDIDNVTRLYGLQPERTTITTIPEGLPVVVDGVASVTPLSVAWTPGSTHSVSAPAEAGLDPRYAFVRWTDGGALGHSITATQQSTVFTAIYQRQRRFTAGVIAGSGSVSLVPSPAGGYYPDRQLVLITATPDSGSQFFRWTGSSMPAQGFGSGTAKAAIETFQSNSRFLAQFVDRAPTTVDAQPTGRTVTVDGILYMTPAKFIWDPGTTHTVRAASNDTNFAGSSRYTFSSWSDGTADVGRIITAEAEAKTFVAKYRVEHALDVVASGLGTVRFNPSTRNGFFEEGTQVEITAIPPSGQVVRYWWLDAAGGGTTQSIAMDQPKAVGVAFGTALAFRPYNAASFAGGPFFNNSGTAVAPLEIVTLFGANLGPESLTNGGLDQNGRLSSNVGNTRVLFDGTPAPILYASAQQTSVVVPSSVAGKASTTITVERNGIQTSGATYGIAVTVPGLFTTNSSGKGPVAALNENGLVNQASAPAVRGSAIVLFATGAGVSDRSVADGEIMGADLARPLAPVYVRFGRSAGEVLYAGSAPTLVNGVLQVNVRVPADLIPGEVPITLIVGNFSSPPGTTIFVQ